MPKYRLFWHFSVQVQSASAVFWAQPGDSRPGGRGWPGGLCATLEAAKFTPSKNWKIIVDKPNRFLYHASCAKVGLLFATEVLSLWARPTWTSCDAAACRPFITCQPTRCEEDTMSLRSAVTTARLRAPVVAGPFSTVRADSLLAARPPPASRSRCYPQKAEKRASWRECVSILNGAVRVRTFRVVLKSRERP